MLRMPELNTEQTHNKSILSHDVIKEKFKEYTLTRHDASNDDKEQKVKSFVEKVLKKDNPFLTLLYQNENSLKILFRCWYENTNSLTADIEKDNTHEAVLTRFLEVSIDKLVWEKESRLSQYKKNKYNLAFLENFSFVLYENPENAEMKYLQDYLVDTSFTQEEMLKFGAGLIDIKDNHKPEFIIPFFQSFFCARYLVSCLLPEEFFYYRFPFRHKLNPKYGCKDVKEFISKNSENLHYKPVWKFIEEMLKGDIQLNFLKKYFPKSNKDVVQQLYNFNYQFQLHRIDDYELSIHYLKSDEPFYPRALRLDKLYEIVLEWLKMKQLADRVVTTLDENLDSLSLTVKSNDKNHIDTILSWIKHVMENTENERNLIRSNKSLLFFNSTSQKEPEKNQKQEIRCTLF